MALLSLLASQQSAPTEATRKKANQLLYYMASQEEAIITYKASDMVFACHSNVGYLSKPNAKGKAGGILSNKRRHSFVK